MKKIIILLTSVLCITSISFSFEDKIINKYILFRGNTNTTMDVVKINEKLYVDIEDILYLNNETYNIKENVIQIIRKDTKVKEKYIYSNGDIHIGKMVNGLREGKGITYIHEGGKIEGYFVSDKLEGEGKKILPRGEYYVGNFSEGFFDGKGEYHFVSGDTYKGDFLYGIREGVGVMYYKNEDTYKGEWKNNVYHGYGALRTESLKQGIWDNGDFVKYAPAEKINEVLKSSK